MEAFGSFSFLRQRNDFFFFFLNSAHRKYRERDIASYPKFNPASDPEGIKNNNIQKGVRFTKHRYVVQLYTLHTYGYKT